jgi:CHAT domain-containing protein
MRRVLVVAGARTLIMGLWEMPAHDTFEWMLSLYETRLRDGLDTPRAVHAATKSLLDWRRREGKSLHPALWGGFVAAGDWH